MGRDREDLLVHFILSLTFLLFFSFSAYGTDYSELSLAEVSCQDLMQESLSDCREFTVNETLYLDLASLEMDENLEDLLAQDQYLFRGDRCSGNYERVTFVYKASNENQSRQCAIWFLSHSDQGDRVYDEKVFVENRVVTFRRMDAQEFTDHDPKEDYQITQQAKGVFPQLKEIFSSFQWGRSEESPTQSYDSASSLGGRISK